MKFYKYLFVILVLFSLVLTSCETDEPKSPSSSKTTSDKQKISRPSFDKYLSTSDKASFSIRVRFKTGGDKESNIGAIVHWKAYSGKQTKVPKKSELTKSEKMRIYGSATYHKTGSKKGMTESIVFDKSHASYGKCYIYYYVECQNSVGSAESSVTYMVTI